MRLTAPLTLLRASLRTSLRTSLVVAAVASAALAGPLLLSSTHHTTPTAQAAAASGGHPSKTHPAKTHPAKTHPAKTHPAAAGQGFVRVRGDVGHPLRLTDADLAALPQQTEQTTYSANGVPVTATFGGPLLVDVLDQAQPSFDPNVKNDSLRFAVLVKATDGYQAVVSWGEIDPGFEGKQVLLALTQDGAPLKRPRLVVPGDARGGRYVSDVHGVQLVDLGHGH